MLNITWHFVSAVINTLYIREVHLMGPLFLYTKQTLRGWWRLSKTMCRCCSYLDHGAPAAISYSQADECSWCNLPQYWLHPNSELSNPVHLNVIINIFCSSKRVGESGRAVNALFDECTLKLQTSFFKLTIVHNTNGIM